MALKILIVEDDESTRGALREMLSQAGYEATVAGTFHDGAYAMVANPPDLLIADVRLGDYNGLQLLATAPRPVPAIVISGFADPVLQEDARRLGADYLVKPVSPPELLMLVDAKAAMVRKTRVF